MHRWKQFTELPKIKNLSADDQRREYYRYQNRMYEATTNPSAAASSAAAGAGGSRKKAVNGSAAIYYRIQDGAFDYSITNFDKGTTSPLTTRTYPVDTYISNTYNTQEAGFFFWLYNDTTAKDYLFYIALDGAVKEYVLDYSIDIITYYVGKYTVFYYQNNAFNMIVLSPEGVRELTLGAQLENIVEWGFDSNFPDGFAFSTTNDNIESIYILNDGSSTPKLVTTVDTDNYAYSLYMANTSSSILLRVMNLNLSNTTDLLLVYDTNGNLVTGLDTIDLCYAPYTIQSGDTKLGIAEAQGCDVARLELLNPGYDLDNLVEGDEINGFSTLNFSNIYFMNLSGNFIISLNTNGLTNNGLLHVNYYNAVARNFSRFTEFDDKTIEIKSGNSVNWDSTYDNISGSALIYVKGPWDSDNGFFYPTTLSLIPVFGTDEELREPIVLATQSDGDSIYYRNIGVCDEDPMLENDRIRHIIDENRRGPGIYHFTDFAMGQTNSIEDGGLDMFDGGNIMIADSSVVSYTHTQQSDTHNIDDNYMGLSVPYFHMDGEVSGDAILGATATYFTNLYPGLFVMCAKNTDIDEFSVTGFTGHDFQGLTYSNSFQITSSASNVYQVFLNSIYNVNETIESEPSINQIIIVNAATSSGITQTVAEDTDTQLHSVSGLQGSATEVHYLLLSHRCSRKLTDEQIIEISTRYVNTVDGLSTSASLSALNLGYAAITDVVDQTTAKYSLIEIDIAGNVTTKPIDVYKSENTSNHWLGKSVFTVRSDEQLQIFGKTGFTDLPDLNSRSWTTFRDANNGNVGNSVIGNELIMWSVKSGNYYKMEFTQWTQGGNGGGFAYTRQLITPSMDEPIIAFTHSNYTTTVDVIEPGVLEISRLSEGNIYNAAYMNDYHTEGPVGTLWNSEYSFRRIYKRTLIDENNETDTVEFLANTGLDDWWSNAVYHLDFVNVRTVYSSDATANKWVVLDEFYDDDYSIFDYVTGDYYNETTTVFYNKLNGISRIFSNAGISATFSVAVEGDAEINIRSVRVSDAFSAFVYTTNNGITGTFSHISYRNPEGNVVAYKKMSDTQLQNYSLVHCKNRYFLSYYDYDRNYKVLTFDGSSIKEVLDVPDTNFVFNRMYNDRLD